MDAKGIVRRLNNRTHTPGFRWIEDGGGIYLLDPEGRAVAECVTVAIGDQSFSYIPCKDGRVPIGDYKGVLPCVGLRILHKRKGIPGTMMSPPREVA